MFTYLSEFPLTGEAETITSHYLFALGAYRALYIVNWVYRFYFEGFFDLIAIVAGCVQTILYCDFFYLYITKGEIKKLLTFDLGLSDKDALQEVKTETPQKSVVGVSIV